MHYVFYETPFFTWIIHRTERRGLITANNYKKHLVNISFKTIARFFWFKIIKNISAFIAFSAVYELIEFTHSL
ncbi:hypothetical protein B1H10_01270 [candidate division KSB1 bacterium 4484_188]|nr:MAG: hypothetical protein B1H10_01270 [candidate division KSB1 bacterium 4484_188]